MYLRIEIQGGFSAGYPYRVIIKDQAPFDYEETKLTASLNERQLIGLRDGINEFLRIKEHIPNSGSAFQVELEKR